MLFKGKDLTPEQVERMKHKVRKAIVQGRIDTIFYNHHKLYGNNRPDILKKTLKDELLAYLNQQYKDAYENGGKFSDGDRSDAFQAGIMSASESMIDEWLGSKKLIGGI